eukprot:gnl/Carplike_NY0171/7357_a10156_142.p1 GENE.gnl/Carplike_NY0171/7357_a10156_142~~gnl/Carplike_NY0171/7357_a10156_142.p1  ORF type:complete len:430 (-),score=83.26 gnl/Carplike_NY0171/7357_a10156_142:24-1271(-)
MGERKEGERIIVEIEEEPSEAVDETELVLTPDLHTTKEIHDERQLKCISTLPFLISVYLYCGGSLHRVSDDDSLASVSLVDPHQIDICGGAGIGATRRMCVSIMSLSPHLLNDVSPHASSTVAECLCRVACQEILQTGLSRCTDIWKWVFALIENNDETMAVNVEETIDALREALFGIEGCSDDSSAKGKESEHVFEEHEQSEQLGFTSDLIYRCFHSVLQELVLRKRRKSTILCVIRQFLSFVETNNIYFSKSIYRYVIADIFKYNLEHCLPYNMQSICGVLSNAREMMQRAEYAGIWDIQEKILFCIKRLMQRNENMLASRLYLIIGRPLAAFNLIPEPKKHYLVDEKFVCELLRCSERSGSSIHHYIYNYCIKYSVSIPEEVGKLPESFDSKYKSSRGKLREILELNKGMMI